MAMIYIFEFANFGAIDKTESVLKVGRNFFLVRKKSTLNLGGGPRFLTLVQDPVSE